MQHYAGRPADQWRGSAAFDPEIPANPPSGTIQQDVAQLGGTSIDPAVAVMPTPNTSACAEGTTINLATPGTMAPANVTGAAATPGVSPAGC